MFSTAARIFSFHNQITSVRIVIAKMYLMDNNEAKKKVSQLLPQPSKDLVVMEEKKQ